MYQIIAVGIGKQNIIIYILILCVRKTTWFFSFRLNTGISNEGVELGRSFGLGFMHRNDVTAVGFLVKPAR